MIAYETRAWHVREFLGVLEREVDGRRNCIGDYIVDKRSAGCAWIREPQYLKINFTALSRNRREREMYLYRCRTQREYIVCAVARFSRVSLQIH